MLRKLFIGRFKGSTTPANDEVGEATYSTAQAAPAEILCSVFLYLPRSDLKSCTLVCRQWSVHSSYLFIRKLKVVSTRRKPLLSTPFLQFAAHARSSHRLAGSVRELRLVGRLHLVELWTTIQLLERLEVLEVQVAFFSFMRIRPSIPSNKRCMLQVLRVLDYFDHGKPRFYATAPSLWLSLWNVLALFSTVEDLVISGGFSTPKDDIRILQDSIRRGVKITGVRTLSISGEISLAFVDLIKDAIDLQSLKKLSILYPQIWEGQEVLRQFTPERYPDLISFDFGIAFDDAIATGTNETFWRTRNLPSGMFSHPSLRNFEES
ncbi:hypothetical protein BDY19DRAFT_636188 [Irpex rosettiformis]|uniref:Uncharacterized protein n=1 Tax=Irpex rosettiformis TaxID=378272 RepID=A0ACB8UBI2_9APHY|nr:hypothetical protein BDY19DRAFT_636188 [Irpex rosettiformis]